MDPLPGLLIGSGLAFAGFVLMLLSMVLDWTDDPEGQATWEWLAVAMLAGCLLLSAWGWVS